jgi:hypothetical protein
VHVPGGAIRAAPRRNLVGKKDARADISMLTARIAVLLCWLSCATAFNIVPRRQALQIGLGFGALAAPLAPASAKSKASVSPNKPEGVGANAGQYLSEYKKNEYKEMKGDKGTRGVASKSFEKNDTVQLIRDKYGGKPPGPSGTKYRTPEELGLKQWSG